MPILRRKRLDAETPPPDPGSRPGNSLVASAALVSQSALRRIQKNAGWQAEGWQYYDRCSTLRVALNWLGAACSRATLFIAVDDPAAIDEPTQVDDAQAEDVLAQLSQRRTNSTMLRTLGIHMSLAGESYLTGYDDPATKLRKWQTLSADDLKMVGTKLAVDQGDGVRLVLEQGQFQVNRLWRPHPRWSAQADSPVRSLMADLAELTGLSQHVLATIDSRLAGNGILAVPESVTAPPVAGDQLHDDPVMSALIEAMTTPIQDRDSAAAVVPLLLRVPDIAAGKLQHLRFGTDFDARISEMRKEAIERVAAGIELPTAIVSGLEDANHWTAWQIEESSVKLYVNPLVALICDALTIGYLRPALKAIDHPRADELIIWYDTSDLILRPDRSKESIELHDRGLVGDETTRRENGFSEDDAPTDQEMKRWVLLQLVKALPALAPEAIPQIDPSIKPINVPTVTPAPPQKEPVEPGPVGQSGKRSIPEQRPTNAGPAGTGGPPASGSKPAPMPSAAVLVAAELGVLRALEVAGNRLLTPAARGQFGHLDRWELHTKIKASDPAKLLDRAFTVLDRVLPDMASVVRVCHEYTRGLIETQTPYHRKTLHDALGPLLDGRP